MKLNLYIDRGKKVSLWTKSFPKYVEGIFKDEELGYENSAITCREYLYNTLERNQNIMAEKSIGKFVPRISLVVGTNKSLSSIKKIFKYTRSLNNYLYYTNEGELKNKDMCLSPMIYSTMALIIKNYAHIFDFKNCNAIPIRILNDIITGRINFYIIDNIYTAYFIYILLNPDYQDYVLDIYTATKTNFSNGPGTAIYGNYKYFHNIADSSWTGGKARDWWKKEKIKEKIKRIMNRKAGLSKIDKKILQNFMEE